MKKLIALVMVGGMLAGGMSVADAKKKKPRKIVKEVPTNVDFFVRMDDCGGDADNPRLSIEDGTDGGSGCGNTGMGIFNEALIAIEDTPAAQIFPAVDGVPFTLDASKDVAGQLNLQSFQGDAANPAGVSAGQTKVDITLTGNVGGASQLIGTASEEYVVTPDKTSYLVEFTIDADDALNKKKFTSLELTVTQRGVSVLHGFIGMDDPASFLTLPTIVKKTVKK